jgi:hypothetical protein
MNVRVAACVALTALALFGPAHNIGAQTVAPAEPSEPVAAILNALRTHQVVGLGTGSHNNEQGHAFVLSVIRHPDFPAAEVDLVVECGTARFQDVMDRFTVGEDVPYEALRRVWEDTTQPHAGCDTPIHEELYRAVRTVNGALTGDRRVRVLLGDPPIDWDSATAKRDRDKFMLMRDSYPAALIQQEILAKGRRALVVYGQGHLQRKQMLSNYDMSHPIAQTIVSLLESAGVKVFTVWGNTRANVETLQPNVATWPRPSLATLRGSVLGAEDFRFFFSDIANRVAIKDGRLVPISREEWRNLRMEDQFDALLYLGRPSSITTAQLPAKLCFDRAYMKMRLARLEAYAPKDEVDRFKQHCAEPLK